MMRHAEIVLDKMKLLREGEVLISSFFCPPPSVHLSGGGWKNAQFRMVSLWKSARGTVLKQLAQVGQMEQCTAEQEKIYEEKVDKQHVQLEQPSASEEPVSQLHKCAFQMIDKPTAYLGLNSFNQDQIIEHEAIVNPKDPTRHQISDGAAWTIIGVEKVEYRFFELLGPVRRPVAPAPVIENCYVFGPSTPLRVEFEGSNFSARHTVWLYDVPLETRIRSESQMWATIPHYEQMRSTLKSNLVPLTGRELIDSDLPFSIVRKDGLIYTTKFSFSYKNEDYSEQRDDGTTRYFGP